MNLSTPMVVRNNASLLIFLTSGSFFMIRLMRARGSTGPETLPFRLRALAVTPPAADESLHQRSYSAVVLTRTLPSPLHFSQVENSLARFVELRPHTAQLFADLPAENDGFAFLTFCRRSPRLLAPRDHRAAGGRRLHGSTPARRRVARSGIRGSRWSRGSRRNRGLSRSQREPRRCGGAGGADWPSGSRPRGAHLVALRHFWGLAPILLFKDGQCAYILILEAASGALSFSN